MSNSPKAVRNCACKHVVGDKDEVWRGDAKHTKGGLTKGDLMKNKRGKVVSKKKHLQGMVRLKPYRVVKPNCEKKKGPVTFICGAPSKGAHLVDNAVAGESGLSPVRRRSLRAVRK
jgi:hypothetical protein